MKCWNFVLWRCDSDHDEYQENLQEVQVAAKGAPGIQPVTRGPGGVSEPLNVKKKKIH